MPVPSPTTTAVASAGSEVDWSVILTEMKKGDPASLRGLVEPLPYAELHAE